MQIKTSAVNDDHTTMKQWQGTNSGNISSWEIESNKKYHEPQTIKITKWRHKLTGSESVADNQKNQNLNNISNNVGRW